jgi:hypothetical protein
LTERLGIAHPVISAPMAFAAGGRLAAAVSNAGGLGPIGGGCGDRAWVEAQFREAGNARIGYGFITGSLKGQPHVLDAVLEHNPAAVFRSFDDPAMFACQIKDAGAARGGQSRGIGLPCSDGLGGRMHRDADRGRGGRSDFEHRAGGCDLGATGERGRGAAEVPPG